MAGWRGFSSCRALKVKADTILMELSNPELKQAAFDAEWAVKGAEADLTKLKVQLASDELTQRSKIASLKSDCEQAWLMAQADETLMKDKLVAVLTAKASRAKADDLRSQVTIEEERLKINEESTQAQLAAQRALVEKGSALLALKRAQVEGLQVRARH